MSTSTATLLALALPTTLVGWVVLIIVVVGVLAILFTFLQARGVAIPPEAKQYGWIVIAVVLALLAVAVIAGVAGRI